MEKAAVIYNPAAGQNKLAQSIGTIMGKLLGNFREVSIYRTEKAGDGASYTERVAEEVDLLIAAGGDGTVNEVINALCPLENRPAFAIIPGGTSNDFSRAIGMAQDPVKATDQLVEKHIKSIDVGKTDERYFLNFWGIGLITQISETVDSESKGIFGRFSYYIRTMQNLSQVESFHLQVRSEDFEFDGEADMLIVGNGTFTGGIQAFFPKGNIQDGLLDVLLIKDMPLHPLLSVFQAKMDEEFLENEEGLVYFQTDKLQVTATPKQTVDCDGERSHSTPSEISILPNHLNMLVGDIQNQLPLR
ncbi:MAG TPA: diacylglycerol kinase family protein [Bacillales bacterium]